MRNLIVLSLIFASTIAKAINPVTKERAPETIQALPQEIRQDLAIRHCLIPKYIGDEDSMDSAYTKGHFRSGTSLDYAVVCHIPARKIQSVLVYSYPESSTKRWTGEVVGQGTFNPNGYSCESRVGVATPAEIRRHTRAYAPEKLKSLGRLDHEGVDIDSCEKASIVRYFRNGRWLQYQGSD